MALGARMSPGRRPVLEGVRTAPPTTHLSSMVERRRKHDGRVIDRLLS
jgi:hypothetical protein